MTEEVLRNWIESKRFYVKPSTLAQYQRVCYKILLPELQEHGFEGGCRSLEAKLLGQYKPKTAKDVALVANQCMKFAFDEGGISNFIKIGIRPPKQKNPRIQVLNLYEQGVFTRFLLSDSDYSKLGILLSLHTGLRLGEICSLQVKDVDLNAKIIRITKTVQRLYREDGTTEHHFGTPKTEHSEREIPIPNFLIKLMRPFLSPLSPSCYVASGTERFVQPRTCQNRLKSYFRKCGLPEYHFHTLRHTFATRAVELGFDIKSLSEILGHANVKITLNLYVHPSMEQKRAEMEKLSALVQS